MPDWTDYLTEEEREAEKRHFESMAGRICNQCSEGWPCITKGAYGSLAASRALVAEKDRALRETDHTGRCESNLQLPQYLCIRCCVLALTEAEMLERLEAK